MILFSSFITGPLGIKGKPIPLSGNRYNLKWINGPYLKMRPEYKLLKIGINGNRKNGIW
jgi:hypothetical protein